MKKYITIGMGGCLGAIFRYLIKGIPIATTAKIPTLTLAVNISGCFVLALFLTYAQVSSVPMPVQMGVSTGLLGAFTTFSTLCKESVQLIGQGEWFIVLFYLSLSIVFGAMAIYAGKTAIQSVLEKRRPSVLDERTIEPIVDESEI